MNVDSAKTLFAYNRWANDRMLQSVTDLSCDELERQFPVSFGSLQATLAHLIGVEGLYLQRWAGNSPSRLPGIGDFPNMPSLQKYWHTLPEEQNRFLATLTDEKLQQPFSYINFKGERCTYRLGDIVQHMVNHSTYHRGQVVFLLRMLGHEPASTDYLLYFDEQGKWRT